MCKQMATLPAAFCIKHDYGCLLRVILKSYPSPSLGLHYHRKRVKVILFIKVSRTFIAENIVLYT